MSMININIICMLFDVIFVFFAFRVVDRMKEEGKVLKDEYLTIVYVPELLTEVLHMMATFSDGNGH